LLPLKRALTEVEHDVRDTHLALEQVSLNNYSANYGNHILEVARFDVDALIDVL
jgi:hypothetical protein